MNGQINLVKVMRTHPALLEMMPRHYSAPKGFVGRNICYLVEYDDGDLSHERVIFGAIVGGSATRFLPGRWEKLGAVIPLNNVVNNTFYHVEKRGDPPGYPLRNFTTQVVSLFRETIRADWKEKYGDEVLAFETLVELPRTGECYRRDGWIECGVTKGYTCKRVAGKGTDSWTGKRVWNTNPNELRPKRVFVRKCDPKSDAVS